MIICGTGHRPHKLGGYSDEVFERLVGAAQAFLADIHDDSFIGPPEYVISGMALGWDQALAQACWNLQIPFHAYIPFEGQELKWPASSQKHFNILRQRAAKTVICNEGGYAAWKMQSRNEVMVDNADVVVALWDGSKGGTANCIDYAQKQNKQIVNLWDKYKKE